MLADADGDMIFSSFDTRDLDKSEPDMKCGTHIITGGTGKYKGITGSEPFACNGLPALAGAGGYSLDGHARTTRVGRSSSSLSLAEPNEKPSARGFSCQAKAPSLVIGQWASLTAPV